MASRKNSASKNGGEESPPPPRKRSPQARTATGKKADPHVLEQAAQSARAGLRERTEFGHMAAGRTPPSQAEPTRRSGATKVVVDESIRSYVGPPITEDQKLLQSPSDAFDFTRTDPWRVMRIMSEFIEGFDRSEE